jgi:hypothetical protein
MDILKTCQRLILILSDWVNRESSIVNRQSLIVNREYVTLRKLSSRPSNNMYSDL